MFKRSLYSDALIYFLSFLSTLYTAVKKLTTYMGSETPNCFRRTFLATARQTITIQAKDIKRSLLILSLLFLFIWIISFMSYALYEEQNSILMLKNSLEKINKSKLFQYLFNYSKLYKITINIKIKDNILIITRNDSIPYLPLRCVLDSNINGSKKQLYISQGINIIYFSYINPIIEIKCSYDNNSYKIFKGTIIYHNISITKILYPYNIVNISIIHFKIIRYNDYIIIAGNGKSIDKYIAEKIRANLVLNNGTRITLNKYLINTCGIYKLVFNNQYIIASNHNISLELKVDNMVKNIGNIKNNKTFNFLIVAPQKVYQLHRQTDTTYIQKSNAIGVMFSLIFVTIYIIYQWRKHHNISLIIISYMVIITMSMLLLCILPIINIYNILHTKYHIYDINKILMKYIKILLIK